MHFCRQLWVIEFFLEFLIKVFGLSFALLKVLLKNPWPEWNKSLQSLIGWNSLPVFLIIKSTQAKNTQVFWVHWQISYNGRFSGGKITAAFLVWRQIVQRQTLQRQNYGGFFDPIVEESLECLFWILEWWCLMPEPDACGHRTERDGTRTTGPPPDTRTREHLRFRMVRMAYSRLDVFTCQWRYVVKDRTVKLE